METPHDGHVVYFIAADCWLKVGYSSDVRKRMQALQTSNPIRLQLVHVVAYDNRRGALRGERVWRRLVSDGGLDTRGEWVRLEQSGTVTIAGDSLATNLAMYGLRLRPVNPSWEKAGRRKMTMPQVKKPIGPLLLSKIARIQDQECIS